jgi:glycosyltransferase involved in cell wall biosynthesis
MKILHVQKVAGIGGSERHLLDLLPSLAARGVAVRMAVLAAGEAGRFLAAARARGVEVAVLPAGPDLNPLVVARLAREIRRFRPDLVHTHLIHADLHGAVAAALAGVPTVASFHGTHRFFDRRPIQLAERRALRRARRVIAISRWIREFLLSRGLARSDQVDVVYYGTRAGGAPPACANRCGRLSAWRRLGRRASTCAKRTSPPVCPKSSGTSSTPCGARTSSSTCCAPTSSSSACVVPSGREACSSRWSR